MSQQELLKRVVQTLNQAGIEYMLTGSVASSLQGEPRSTHDIDLVITIQKPQMNRLIQAFTPPDFYIDKDSILEAIQRKSMFNLINIKSGDKVDFWLLTDEAFDKSRFSRRSSEKFMGITLRVSSPEDTIMAKLRWAKMSGGSEKQFTDALRVYEVQCGNLDTAYIEKWVKKLEVDVLWNRLKKQAEIK
ncbi:MAG: hypothetical protein HY762_02865 [Planctomycetes bacterium]|nr:hypothetical protein [Planctomycetota bacterium]